MELFDLEDNCVQIRALRRAIALVAVGVTLLALAPTISADEGLATWYGPGFQGSRMSNGQVFDMYDPTTVASNQYAFGTWLMVTNPANGKSVWVQVRDRGPFGSAALKLDLSYAAAAAIQTKPTTILVRYEVVAGPGAEPASAAPAAKPAPAPAPAAKPAPAPTATPVPRADTSARSGRVESAPNQYTVQPGDSLWSIASRFGLDPDAIQAANGIERPESLTAGQTIVLQGPAKPAAKPAPAAGGTHVVASGETLGGIAASYGVSADDLARLNGISDPDALAEGQTLTVPTARAASAATITVTGQSYTVCEGDALFDIALAAGADFDEVARLNGIEEPYLLQPGDVIKLP